MSNPTECFYCLSVFNPASPDHDTCDVCASKLERGEFMVQGYGGTWYWSGDKDESEAGDE